MPRLAFSQWLVQGPEGLAEHGMSARRWRQSFGVRA
jgi:hypothetical protein